MKSSSNALSLPAPRVTGGLPIDTALAKRRSVRAFQDKPLTKEMLSQLLWSLQGVSDRAGYRTAPSAGALYPLEIYVLTQDGSFHYDPRRHELIIRGAKDLRPSLCRAAYGQESIQQSPAVFVIAAVYERTAIKYGAERAERYVFMECGHAAQNLLLETVSLGLGAVPMGAFHDAHAAQVLGLPSNEHAIYIIPVGHPR